MSTRRTVLVVLLGAALVALVAVVVWEPEIEAPTPPTTGLKVIVVGIDGLDWFLLGRYLGDDELPAFARLLRSGVRGEVTPDRPYVPEVGWTQLGRGRILTENEQTRIAEGADQRLFGIAPHLIELVNESGKSSLCVGWPASWPARESEAALVAPYSPAAPCHELALTPTLFLGAPGEASTAELAEFVNGVVTRNEESYGAEFEERVFHGAGGDDPIERDRLAAARWAFLSDSIVLDIGARLTAEREPDLTLIHLGGLDAVTHRFLAAATPEYFEDLPDAARTCSEVLPNYYRVIDDALARILRLVDERTVLFVCSVYGTHPTQPAGTSSVSGAHDRGPCGVFIAWGPNLVTTDATLAVSTLDLAPTVLAALGVPIPEDAEGRPLTEALPVWLPKRFPVSHVKPASPPGESILPPPELAMMEELTNERLAAIRAGLGG